MEKEQIRYSYNDILLAINAVQSGESIIEVSHRTGIPISALRYHIEMKAPLPKKLIKPTVLTSEEEQVIVQWLFYMSSRGFQVTKTQLLNNVDYFIKNLNRTIPTLNDRLDLEWYEDFLRRHPDISGHVAQNLTLNSFSVTEENLKAWFQGVKLHLDKIGIDTFDGSRIFNLDDSVFFLCPKNEKVSNNKGVEECLAVAITTNAVGMLAPILVLCKYVIYSYNITKNVPSDWAIGKCRNGCITTEIFNEYIMNIFHPWLTEKKIQRPVVLYVDDHSSYVTYSAVQFCLANQIELISLNSNSTHILHPLDAALFKPLEEVWRKNISDFRIKNKKEIQRQDFYQFLKSTIDCLDLPNIMCNGFRKTGLYPFCPNVLKCNELQNSKPSEAITNVEKDTDNKKAMETNEVTIDNETNENIVPNNVH